MVYSNLTLNTIKENDEEIEVKVSGIIDTVSSDNFGNAIIDLHNRHPKANIVLDFKDVEMVTSSCLRYLLSFEKEHYDYEISNVKREVFTVLKLTGLANVINANQETISIDTKDCKLIGKGFSSEVYKLDDETIAKIYYNLPELDTLLRERIIAKRAFVKGVPTEISFGLCECQGKPGLIYELVNADTLISLLADNFSDAEKYIEDYVKLVKEVHKYDSNGIPELPSTKDILRGDIIELTKNGISEDEANKLRRQLDEIPDSDTLLHGDPHPSNIMVSNENMTLIDLSDMRTGDEIFDLVYLYRTLYQFARMPGNEYALNEKQANHLFDLFFNEYYKDLGEEDKKKKLQKIHLLSLISILSKFFMFGKEQSTIDIYYNDLKSILSTLD